MPRLRIVPYVYSCNMKQTKEFDHILERLICSETTAGKPVESDVRETSHVTIFFALYGCHSHTVVATLLDEIGSQYHRHPM